MTLRARIRLLALVAALAMRLGAGESLTIATYNVENYGLADRMTESGFRPAYPKPEREKSALRAVLGALAADIVVFQELGGQPFLDELQRDLASGGVHYPHAVLGTADDADRRLAVLARRAPARVVTHTDLAFTYFGERTAVKRGLLEVTFIAGSTELTVFVVHLKSRFTERPDDPLSALRRAGEATAIRDRILQRFPEPGAARFIVLGDCNDTRTSRTMAALQRRGRTEIARLLPAADSRGEVWTHAFVREETYTRVDQVLVSPALLPHVRGGAGRIYDGPGVAEASDHRPILVTLDAL